MNIQTSNFEKRQFFDGTCVSLAPPVPRVYEPFHGTGLGMDGGAGPPVFPTGRASNPAILSICC